MNAMFEVPNGRAFPAGLGFSLRVQVDCGASKVRGEKPAEVDKTSARERGQMTSLTVCDAVTPNNRRLPLY
jgi:hypothetical protein